MDCRRASLPRRLDIQPTRMSFHLTTLERAGLLTTRTRRPGISTMRLISTEDAVISLSFLMEDCCGSNPAICGFTS